MSSDDDLNDPPEKRPRMRRESGARKEVEEPVLFRQGERRIEGWCLNLSHGGLRAALDTTVEVGEEFEVTIGDHAAERRARVVWVRTGGGGQIVGLAFEDGEGSVPPDEDTSG